MQNNFRMSANANVRSRQLQVSGIQDTVNGFLPLHIEVFGGGEVGGEEIDHSLCIPL